eukprot:GHVR01192162.1.p1 GENE.GHVR01192162.1~~GHVR01192162.1.p1  ORF type:complete len:196 (+),score=24.35 GHVR01192162.1:39-626(+)
MYLLLFLSLSLFSIPTECIRFTVEMLSSQKKCFGEEMSQRTLVIAKISSTDEISVVISGPQETIFTQKDQTVAETAFTTQKAGAHMFCVQNLLKKKINVEVDIRWGPQAKDYSEIAKMEHLEPLVTILRKAEDSLQSYHKRLLHMRDREVRMRKTNDSTNRRVILFTVLSIVIMITLSCCQAYSFKSFFRAKKII